MVDQVNRSGLHDWLAQRATAILIGLYTVFLMAYFLVHPQLTFESWRGLFESTGMRISTVIVLISILWHAWIGLWTVLTDYIKIKRMRILLEILIIILLLGYFVWLIEILWRH